MEFTKTQIKEIYEAAESHLEHELYDQFDIYHNDIETEIEISTGTYGIYFSGIVNSNEAGHDEGVKVLSIEVDDLQVNNEELEEYQSI